MEDADLDRAPRDLLLGREHAKPNRPQPAREESPPQSMSLELNASLAARLPERSRIIAGRRISCEDAPKAGREEARDAAADRILLYRRWRPHRLCDGGLGPGP
jgi:hypothetical protein